MFASHARKRCKAGKPGPPVHNDLLAVVDDKGRVRHEFTATAPNLVWLTDITEHRTGEGKLYLCAIKDCYSNKIVGYSIASYTKSSLPRPSRNVCSRCKKPVVRRSVESGLHRGSFLMSDWKARPGS